MVQQISNAAIHWMTRPEEVISYSCVGAAEAADPTLRSPVEPEEREDMDMEAVAHGLVLLVVHLQELRVRVLLGKLTNLIIRGKSQTDSKKIFRCRSINQGNNATLSTTLGWRARHPPHPGEKKSTMTSLSPALSRESARSCADSTSRMLGCTPFSHHLMDLQTIRFIYGNQSGFRRTNPAANRTKLQLKKKGALFLCVSAKQIESRK